MSHTYRESASQEKLLKLLLLETKLSTSGVSTSEPETNHSLLQHQWTGTIIFNTHQ